MDKQKIDENPILRLSFEFSLLIIEFCEKLQAEKKYVIANQLLKAGTSIGANAMEAQNPESNADFIHKFKVAAKEGGETFYWLLLCDYSKTYPECKDLLARVHVLNSIIGKIITSAKGN